MKSRVAIAEKWDEHMPLLQKKFANFMISIIFAIETDLWAVL